ncbi:MAG: DUF1569 domain-containing protein [Acidobacteria bacterium]|nr:DUF1569 domain-containing protein [Acidobacteriota bacterium]
MKTLLNANDKAEILSRLLSLREDSPRQWGKMTPHQMICHLSDSYLIAMGEREARWAGNFVTKTVFKFVALSAPMKWPKGVKTGPAADQEQNGTRPVDFDQDQQRLRALINRFTSEQRDFQFAPHPIFGEMTVAEWMRWGYLHADHHFRQFGS